MELNTWYLYNVPRDLIDSIWLPISWVDRRWNDDICRPAYLYRFSRDIPILALNHDFPISCGGVPILEDAGIFRARRFRFVFAGIP